VQITLKNICTAKNGVTSEHIILDKISETWYIKRCF